MGWLCNTTPQRKSDFVAEKLKMIQRSEGLTLHRHAVRGNHLWLDVTSDRTGRRLACLFMLDCYEGCWGYKDVDESMGISQTDCPVSWLKDLSPPPNENSSRWREAVRRDAANRNSRRTAAKRWAAGDRVTFTHAPTYGVMTLAQSLGRRGWATHEGYRIPARVMRLAERVA